MPVEFDPAWEYRLDSLYVEETYELAPRSGGEEGVLDLDYHGVRDPRSLRVVIDREERDLELRLLKENGFSQCPTCGMPYKAITRRSKSHGRPSRPQKYCSKKCIKRPDCLSKLPRRICQGLSCFKTFKPKRDAQVCCSRACGASLKPRPFDPRISKLARLLKRKVPLWRAAKRLGVGERTVQRWKKKLVKTKRGGYRNYREGDVVVLRVPENTVFHLRHAIVRSVEEWGCKVELVSISKNVKYRAGWAEMEYLVETPIDL